MIKKATIIRNINEKQRKQLLQVMETNKIKTVSKALLFSLDQSIELQKENERLKRIIDIKTKRMETLNNKLDGNI